MVLRVFRAIVIAGAAVLTGTLVAFIVILGRDPLPADAAPLAGPALARLPIIEVQAPASSASDTLVVYYTGDNGWRDNDRAFTRGLADLGAPVVAVDTLHYFVRKHSPEAAAADLAAVIDHYSARLKKTQLVLIGYSYGANVLPTIMRRLPARLRARVDLLALIAPVGRVQLVLRPYSMMDITGPGARSNIDELEKLKAPSVICIYGAQDDYALCPAIPPRLSRRIRLTSGHQFLDSRDAVVTAIAAAARLNGRPF